MRTDGRSLSFAACLSLAFASLSAPFAAGCTAGTGDDAEASEDELRTEYRELNEVLEGDDYERWFNVRRALVRGFDNICGDTICGGDYSNLTTLDLTCSATTKQKKLRDCTWVLAGSIEYVSPVTGAIANDIRTFTCKMPIGGNAKTLLDTFTPAGEDALNTPLPSTGKSFYDGLVDCFAGVVGAPPPADAQGPYVELQDYLWNGGGDGDAWSNVRRTLNKNFDDVCGDSFCEGEYSDVYGLRFACAVDTAKNKVRNCSWSFAMTETSVDAGGRVQAAVDTRTCSVSFSNVNPATLVSALNNDDPLNTRLPGKKVSLYETLIGCL